MDLLGYSADVDIIVGQLNRYDDIAMTGYLPSDDSIYVYANVDCSFEHWKCYRVKYEAGHNYFTIHYMHGDIIIQSHKFTLDTTMVLEVAVHYENFNTQS